MPVSGIISDVSVFEPLYFWSYTMFRNCFYNNYYLGYDQTGKTTLVENWDLSYPDPQALFILNTFYFDRPNGEGECWLLAQIILTIIPINFVKHYF